MMKFNINTKIFNKIINKANRAVDTRTTIPILSGIKLETDKNGLTVIGMNSDIGIVQKITPDKKNNLQVTEPSKQGVVIKAKFFRSVIRSLPGKDVTISSDDNLQVKIASGKSHFRINGLDGSNYPHLPKVSDDNEVTLSGDLLKEIIKETAVDASTQESRPILTGINLSAKNGKLTAVATDSHRLGLRVLNDSNEDANYDLTIPADSLDQLSRLIGKQENVKMSFAESQVVFKVNNLTFYSRTIEGNYPDINGLVPQSKLHVSIQADKLLRTIQQAAIISHASRNNAIKLVINNKNLLTILADSPDVGNAKESAIAENIQDDREKKDNFAISFNPDYMIDALQLLGNQLVQVNFLTSLRPFVIVPTKAKEGKFVQLITPIRTF